MTSDLDRLLNLPLVLTYEGRQYEAYRLSIRQLAKFASWLRARAVAVLEDLEPPIRGVVSKEIAAQIDSGAYDVGGEASIVALRAVPGMSHVLFLALRDRYPECDEDRCRKILTADFDNHSRIAHACGQVGEVVANGFGVLRWSDLLRSLVGGERGVPLRDLIDLTPDQIIDLFLWERNENGWPSDIRPRVDESVAAPERYRRHMWACGYPDRRQAIKAWAKSRRRVEFKQEAK